MNATSYSMALAFDVGLKRTGMAVAQSTATSAQAAGVIDVTNGQHDWHKVEQVIAQWQPSVIVLGKTSTTDPALKKATNRLLSYIQQRHKIETVQIDETLTTVSANELLSNRGYNANRRHELRDQVAACLILETWLQQHPPANV